MMRLFLSVGFYIIIYPVFTPMRKNYIRRVKRKDILFEYRILQNGYNYQIYRQPLPCKAEASFSKIKISNKVHQCDILLHTYDQDGEWVFVCTLLVIDVATRFKDERSLTSRNSLEI